MRSPVVRCLSLLAFLWLAAAPAPGIAEEKPTEGAGTSGAAKDGKRPAERSPAAYEVLHRFEGHEGIVRSVAFRPGSTLFVSGGSDRTVRVWDAETGKSVARQELPRGG